MVFLLFFLIYFLIKYNIQTYAYSSVKVDSFGRKREEGGTGILMDGFRNLKRSKPKDCKLIGKENFNYTLFNQEVRSGSAWYCD